jgi:hypothetical protein
VILGTKRDLEEAIDEEELCEEVDLVSATEVKEKVYLHNNKYSQVEQPGPKTAGSR